MCEVKVARVFVAPRWWGDHSRERGNRRYDTVRIQGTQ